MKPTKTHTDLNQMLKDERRKQFNAKADVFLLGPMIRMSCELSDLSVEDRRGLFRALLQDEGCNPGQKAFTSEEAKPMFALLDKWCGWDK